MKKFLLLLLILMPYVAATGIGPARTVVDFAPEYEQKHYFFISAEEDSIINVERFGESSMFLDIKNINRQLSPGMNKFNYTIRLPERLEPRVYTGGIKVIYTTMEKDTQLSSEFVLIHQIWIDATSEDVLEPEYIGKVQRIEEPQTKAEITPEDCTLLICVLIFLIIVFFVFLGLRFYVMRYETLSVFEKQQLDEYIKELRKRNIPDEMIEAELLNAGWSRSQIKERMKLNT